MGTDKDLEVYAKTFQKAADLAGEAQPPLAIFLQAIDYVLDETAPPRGIGAASPN